MEKILSGQQRRRQQKMNPYKFTSFQTEFGAKIQIQGVPTSFGKEFSKRRKICESLFTFLTNFLSTTFRETADVQKYFHWLFGLNEN